VGYEHSVDTLDIGGLRVVWSPDLGFAPVEPEVAALAEDAARALTGAGGLRVVDRPVSLTDPVRVWLSAGAADLWTTVDEALYAERSADLDRGSRSGFEATRTWTVPRYARAHARRWQLEEEVAALFEDADLLLTPATAVPAFAAEGHVPRVINGVDVKPAMAVPFTMVANLCWNPSLSVPAGLTADGLPVGLLITGRRHADEVVLRAGRLFEQARPWPRTAPGW
jgi:aspartyl-tRNA(Asn)/glutamyl-tRNA(Gln) amidotransferase subunit A